ncbi:MAG TPA: DNA translocase FtsK [Candidatus Kapabacteria bacterium]|nr:DNA translocase FtsK [Candidatus Kapabacteria bacterium]
MARKAASDQAEGHGRNDILGVVFFALFVIIFISLWTYDRKDLAINSVPANADVNNWIGVIGARAAYALFFVFGAAAYLLPFVLLFLSLGYLLSFLTYVQRRWLWTGVWVFSCMGLLDLYGEHLVQLQQSLNAPSPGGIIGQVMNNVIFRHFGKVGATVVFLTVYTVSLLYLTNFRLGLFIRQAWEDQLAKREASRQQFKEKNIALEEKALLKRAKELEKQAKKLEARAAEQPDVDEEEEAEEILGADLQPVPEPTVRDLSVPQAKVAGKPKAKAESKNGNPFSSPDAPMLEGDVITAREIAAANKDDILGKSTDEKSTPDKEEETDAEAAALSAASVPAKPKITARKPKPITVASTPIIGNYQLPSINMLHMPDTTVKPTESKEELMANARLMQNTLAQFGIEVSLGDITKGPTITRYELHPAPGVRLEKISALTNNIAAALKAERINVLAPVPGKSSVGVEVPNAVKTKVIMRDLLESEEWNNTKARIPLALGKDVYGHPIIADLAEMPHLLIAGSTGSGKSVCINSIIASLLYKFSPDQLRFVMIDPKVVELQQYNALPHLVVPVVTDPKKVVLALRWVVNEMEKRYQIFAKVGVRNIKSFNERPKNPPPQEKEQPELPLNAKKDKVETNAEGFAVELDEEIVVPREDDIVIPEKLSYVVVIIDELADLMLVAPADVEMAIARITQMARAAGIHCIVATQRPSVDVITGVIKANIPARIAFQVAAKVDSRTILDAMGADKLLGKGDMLYLPPGSAKLNRAQGVLITDQEIQSIVDHIAKQGKPSYEVEIHQQLSKPVSSVSDEDACDEDESLIEQCIEVIRSEQKASVSLMQRRLRLGYTRAARIMDELERRGIVGPGKGAEPRDILIDLDGGGADGAGQGLN